MAGSWLDAQWREAMAELNEQLYLEDHTLSLKEGEKAATVPQASLVESVQHWASLYVKYVQIFRALEECFDGMVHPQKRIDLKLILELVATRVLELKQLLVKWNPAHPDLAAPGCEGPMPWLYVNLDDVLVDLKLPPKVLDVPIPRYFREEAADKQASREKLVLALKGMHVADGESGEAALRLGDEGKQATDAPLLDLTMEEAIECLQRCERGRQGMVRGQLMRDLAEEESVDQSLLGALSAHQGGSNGEYNAPDPEIAAANIQRLYRGNKARRKALTERDSELAFIGMRRGSEWDDVEAKHREIAELEELVRMRARRKHEQKDNEEGYSEALIDLHGTVLEEEGPDMREKMMEERRAWFTDELGKGVFPEDLGDFYLAKNPPQEGAEEEGADGKGKGGKDGKGKGVKDAKKDAKGKGKGKGGDGDDEDAERLPPLTGPSLFTATLKDTLERYSGIWLEREESQNLQQKHDLELAKNVVRPNVEEEVRENVDKMLVSQLQNLKTQLEAASGGGKKGKKKKDKGKKGKKGKKDKGKKGKKGKPLPGEKLCSGMQLEEMLALLVQHGIVKEVEPTNVDDLLGEFNFLGSAYQQHSDVRDINGDWVPQDPSASQVRAALTEQIILPLGCSFLRVTAPYAKSVLLYGPGGSGKTLLAKAVAHHTRAIFLHLSPSVLNALPKDLREGKAGPTRLMHMVFAVARSPEFGPGVIHVDQVDKMFAGKKKGAGAGGEASKFKKDLVTYAASLKPEERVVVVGASSEPFNMPDTELKDLRSVFQTYINVPLPDYASRVMLWRVFLKRVFDDMEMDSPPQIDLSALALVSEGYSAGSIKLAIEKTLTVRRKATLRTRPISEKDFITPLSALPSTFHADNARFQAFTANITGLQARRDKVKAMRSGDAAGGDKKGKSKKK